MKPIDLTGTRFHRWSVIGRATNTKQGQAQWFCRCDCGTERILKSIVIRRGISKSCGCLKREGLINRSTKHGHATNGISQTYHSWAGMIARCTDTNHSSFNRYGGRGITVCERWLQFDAFLADMGERPKGTTLDRINGEHGYEPSNCRWATAKDQARNKRNNYRITISGVTRCIAEWAEMRGLHKDLIWERRQRGWSDVDAVMTPVATKHKTKRA